MDNLHLANDLQKIAEQIDKDAKLIEPWINEEAIMVAYHNLINQNLLLKCKIRDLRMGL